MIEQFKGKSLLRQKLVLWNKQVYISINSKFFR